ncbi:MAG: tetratricopeptide repeat protein [Bryobacteraceae bacterium]|nr:tetratricopeptide repeat protein [Bryobacteraceae bacterium]
MHLLFVLAVITVSAVHGAVDSIKERFEAAVQAQRSGDLSTAIRAYREMLERDPRLTRARHLLGICELQAGNRGEGIRQLEAVRREDPSNRQVAYTLVSTYVASGMLQQAAKVVQLDLRGDESGAAYFMRGSLAMAEGHYDLAIRELEHARKLGKGLAGVTSQLGVAYCFTGRLDDALPVLESALQENPLDGNAAAFLGWIYKDRDRDSEAAALLERTVRARPEDQGALFLLAQLTQSRGQSAEALGMLEKVVALDPDHRAAHVLLARLYQKLRRTDDAARERSIIERLNADLQAAQPKAP